MSIFYKVSFPLVGVVCLLLGLCGPFLLFSGSYAKSNAVLDEGHSLKVCSDAGFLPFEMKNSSGQWEGFDVDMMNDFAVSMGVKLEMVQMNFDGIIPALLSKKCDMIAAGMTVTPERKKVVTFSTPTFENSLSIAFKNSREANTKYVNLDSLDKAGMKIAVKTGYTSDIYLTKNLKNAVVLRFDSDTDLF
ncbi:MAG: transporter substrate-binding domain-containing protein, partial [Bdellovibrionota bacterium]